MSPRPIPLARIGRPALARFGRAEDGTTLVELAIVLPLFLLIFLGLIDFGRMGAEYVMAQKAMERAARIAAVRPPACVGVPQFYTRGTDPSHAYGTGCRVAAGVCRTEPTYQCTAANRTATSDEIWVLLSPILPSEATRENLRFRYEYDANLGFLGGPYVPMVTVQLEDLSFRFVTPLAALATLAGAGNSDLPMTVPMPNMSVSLPAEDLAQGNNG
ncbi:TadE-like protein [Cereibacter ovatus]|uniref:TadE-like protein n=1 Tax=Cereibacter ovatus TaxID=439529 RepID=A0A285CSX2_9RHOB|nr:TadE/TadG family type IV pilus assembly protein [Cereibacter ovatus]SNX70604.1 TadE-like protein [Cereibacter ovatus]